MYFYHKIKLVVQSIVVPHFTLIRPYFTTRHHSNLSTFSLALGEAAVNLLPHQTEIIDLNTEPARGDTTAPAPASRCMYHSTMFHCSHRTLVVAIIGPVPVSHSSPVEQTTATCSSSLSMSPIDNSIMTAVTKVVFTCVMLAESHA